ncbi:MAG: hypothetical protein WBH01_05760 [Dehalococcoidia bacterium]
MRSERLLKCTLYTVLILAVLIPMGGFSFPLASLADTTLTGLTVSSKTAWQDTGIDVQAGDTVQIAATGYIQFDSAGHMADPDGQPDGDLGTGSMSSLVPGAPQHTLVGRIGSSGSLTDLSGFLVGSDYSETASESGRLFLGFNDGFVKPDRTGLDSGGVGDNSGSFIVQITIIAALPAKPALAQTVCLQVNGEGLPDGAPIPGWDLVFGGPPPIATVTATAHSVGVHSGDRGVQVNGDYHAGKEFDIAAKGVVTVDYWHFPKPGSSTNSQFSLHGGEHPGDEGVDYWCYLSVHKNDEDLWWVTDEGHPPSVASYSGEYTHIVITIDTSTGLFDLYIDEELVYQGTVEYADRIEASGIRYVSVHSGRGGAGTDSYFDDILITTIGEVSLVDLAIVIYPINGGTVTLSPSQPSGRYVIGTEVTLTAYANEGYDLDHWSGADNDNLNPTTVTMNSNRSVTAYFEEIPPMTPVDRDPEEDLIQPPVLKPYQLQLRVLDPSCSDYDSGQPDPNLSSIDPNKPTIVLAHGWNPDYVGLVASNGKVPASVCEVGGHLLEHGYGDTANVIWWNWLDEAKSKSPVGPSKEAYRQGARLADALYMALGANYDHEIHFIGHSLGARVNKVAIDDLQSAYDWRNFHVTILDAAEIGDLAREANPIPNRAAWIDNYVTAFGDLHDEAVNVILRQKMPISIDPELVGTIQGLAASHSFSYEWYACSIASFDTTDGCKPDPDPELNLMGHQWSFEARGLNGSPGPGSFYVQTLGASDSILNVEGITPGEASVIMAGRTALLIGQSGLIILGAIQKPIEFVGEVVGDTVEVVVEGVVKKVFRAILKEGSSAYMWIPIEIPGDASYMSFEFVFSDNGDGDYLTAGINELQVFAFEGTLFSGSDFVGSGYLDVSDWAGQEVELFVGLNSVGEPNAEVIVQDFRFHQLNSQPFVDTGESDAAETELAKIPWLWVGVGLAILLVASILLRRRLSQW